ALPSEGSVAPGASGAPLAGGGSPSISPGPMKRGTTGSDSSPLPQAAMKTTDKTRPTRSFFCIASASYQTQTLGVTAANDLSTDDFVALFRRNNGPLAQETVPVFGFGSASIAGLYRFCEVARPHLPALKMSSQAGDDPARSALGDRAHSSLEALSM